MKRIEAMRVAVRIVASAPGAEPGALGLLERIFGAEGEGALLAALAHWGLSVAEGEADAERVALVAESLRALL